jgi:hypothetical protein
MIQPFIERNLLSGAKNCKADHFVQSADSYQKLQVHLATVCVDPAGAAEFSLQRTMTGASSSRRITLSYSVSVL